MVNRGKVILEFIFIFYIFGVYVSLVYSKFNFDEIHDVKYGFEILKEPVLLKESSDVGNTVLLSSKHGQQYQCILPDIGNLVKENEANYISSKEEIPLLLQPLKKKCLYNNKGWWTYEVCFGKAIYQYHEEASNGIVGDKISLGFFSNETDWSQEKIEKVKFKPGKSGIAKKFHSQHYVNGSKCDLTGKAREAQIKILCQEGSADLVFRVDEPSSCSYVITVYTNKLCKHALFRSPSSQKSQPITCSPALSKERYKIYIEGIELEKKAKEETKAAKLRAQEAKAAAMERDAEDEIEEDEREEVSFARKKKKKKKPSIRSQLWPWENPGIESEDEVVIDGQIKGDELDVSRLDITKGRKKNANGESVEEGIIITSRKMRREREERKKGDAENDGQDQTIDGVDEDSKEKETLAKEQTEGDHLDEGKDNKNEGDKDKQMKSAKTSGEQKDDNDKKTGKKQNLSAEEWEKKMEEAFLKLRATLKGKLDQQGMTTEDSDQKGKEKPGSFTGKDVENDETSSSKTEPDERLTDDHEAVKNDELEAGKTIKEILSMGSTPGMEKILSKDLVKELLDAATENQAEMEKKFGEQRAEMKKNVEEMRAKVKVIEDEEKKTGRENEELAETINKMKASFDRFEKINMELDDDVLSMKELNAEVLRTLSGESKPDQVLKLSYKAGKLLKKVLWQRIQLEQEAQNIRKMSDKIAGTKESEDKKVDANTAKDGIDQIINKLKTMVQDLDSEEDKERVTQDTTIASDSSTSKGVGEGDTNFGAGAFDQGDRIPGMKVRVSRIKKIDTDDDDEDVADEMTEADLDADEMEELNMDRRIKLATKKMEEMVKQQLRDSGVAPSGRIKVKIVTSKEALENLDTDSKKDVKLLSEKEENQFKDMILNLLGGSPDAGKERKRQQDLEDNYNLIWNDDKLQEVAREDDDTDGEVQVESF